MVHGVFKRAAVTILMIVSLLLPLSTCRAQSNPIRHDCCIHQSPEQSTLGADCCIVQSEIPAVVEEHFATGPINSDASAVFLANVDFATGFELNAEPDMAEHSPPPGTFILRI
jgi:hypothetical protein